MMVQGYNDIEGHPKLLLGPGKFEAKFWVLVISFCMAYFDANLMQK